MEGSNDAPALRRGSRGHLTSRALTSLIAALLLALAACDGDGYDGGGSTPVVERDTPTTQATPGTPVQPGGDPAVSVENVILACREKDADRLRQFVTDSISSSITDEVIDELFGRGADVNLVSQSQETHMENGRGTATVRVRLEVERDGGTETVDREWQLEREEDGVWRFTELPECF